MYDRDSNPTVVFMTVAGLMAPLSSCTRSKVGAVVVDGSDMAAGFNEVRGSHLTCGTGGCPRGSRSYAEQPPGGDYRDCDSVHAEVDAISKFLQLYKVGPSTKLYSTREPCTGCWAYILGTAGIKRENVFWRR